jgi:hypothetical protein
MLMDEVWIKKKKSLKSTLTGYYDSGLLNHYCFSFVGTQESVYTIN